MIADNITVSDCTLKSDGVIGGLIGEMNNPVEGYNILVTDISFDSFTELGAGVTPSYIAGFICGSINTNSQRLTYSSGSSGTSGRTGTTPTIKISGFSRQDRNAPDTTITALTGSSNYGSGEFGTGAFRRR